MTLAGEIGHERSAPRVLAQLVGTPPRKPMPRAGARLPRAAWTTPPPMRGTAPGSIATPPATPCDLLKEPRDASSRCWPTCERKRRVHGARQRGAACSARLGRPRGDTVDDNTARSLEFRLTTTFAASTSVVPAWVDAGGARLQYERRHLRPFDAARSRPRSYLRELGRLGDEERQRHLELLGATDVASCAAYEPCDHALRVDTSWIVLVEQPSFDGRSHFRLELRVNRLAAHAR